MRASNFSGMGDGFEMHPARWPGIHEHTPSSTVFFQSITSCEIRQNQNFFVSNLPKNVTNEIDYGGMDL
jgi:hypothetical protein